jgi:hypothetical protein
MSKYLSLGFWILFDICSFGFGILTGGNNASGNAQAGPEDKSEELQ